MNIAFRVDASSMIGVGHLMRCITLANSLSEYGANSFFISRGLGAQLILLIEQNGHVVLLLPKLETASPATNSCDNKWLGTSQLVDAQDTLKLLNGTCWKWVIVDQYGIGSEWELLIREKCERIMVIDDLADRNHKCDLLLDQTLGRQSIAYKFLLDDDCKVLAGSTYALLRPEFSELRAYSLRRRKTNKLSRILISMGGSDPDNVTAKVLDILNRNGLLNSIEVQIMLTSQSSWVHQLEDQIKLIDKNISLSIDPPNVAKLMAECDLAIGAAGTTAWERCCLGLPALITVLADNQLIIAEAISEMGAALNLGRPKVGSFEANLVQQLQHLRSENNLIIMSRVASKVTDGSGTILVSKIITSF